jgi:hypothetical protein
VITIYLIENHPWVWWTDLGSPAKAGRFFGEWAWVGRVYR